MFQLAHSDVTEMLASFHSSHFYERPFQKRLREFLGYLDNFFVILTYNVCFGLLTLLKDKNFGSLDLYVCGLEQSVQGVGKLLEFS